MRVKTIVTRAALAAAVMFTGCNGNQPNGGSHTQSKDGPGDGERTTAPATTASRPSIELSLEDYRLAAGPFEIDGVRDNLSGVTWSTETTSLWAVVNSPTDLLELTPEGTVKRRLPLRGGGDTEGIAALGDGRLAVTEEGAQLIYVFDIPAAEAKVVDLRKARALPVVNEYGGNRGMEGVAWDAKGRRLFVVKEKRPALYVMRIPAGDEDPDDALGRTVCDFGPDTADIRDAAGACWHAASGRLLVVSDESACVVLCTPEGRELGRLAVNAPQPEGVAIAPDGTLYVVSEPNLLLVYKPE